MPRIIPDAPLTENAPPSGRTRKADTRCNSGDLDHAVFDNCSQFLRQVCPEGNPTCFSFAFPNTKQMFVQVNILDLQPYRLTEARSGTVEDQDEDSHDGVRATVTAETGRFIEQARTWSTEKM